MVFSDLFFLFVFIPLFALLYLIGGGIDKLRKSDSAAMTMRNVVLMIFSLIFYAWGEPIYVLLMLGTVAVNYLIGMLIDIKAIKSIALALGVVVNIAILGSFKYLNFIADSLATIGIDLDIPHIALPIGISFYIFQSISYLVDVYRGEAPAQRNFFNLLLYISMFPQLIAGPIVRYSSVAAQIIRRSVAMGDFAYGLHRFMIGLAKKVIIANTMGEMVSQLLAGDLQNLSSTAAWVSITAFAIQIYFDFSGYSDMAIGLGRCVGFTFPENFNHPYISRTMTEFWRRWHISLGSFFRDYVYIPLGGNRRHQFINILIVWFLTGLWHGASWNFILWGLYFGLIIVIEKYSILRWNIPAIFLHVYSLLLILIGWGLFYFDDFARMQEFFIAFFDITTLNTMPIDVASLLTDNFYIWVAAILLCLPLRQFAEQLLNRIAVWQPIVISQAIQISRAVIDIALLVICVTLLVGATNNAFIYTRF